MPFAIIRNDITKMPVDAIVNTANPRPVIGDGTDRAIHKKAGPNLLIAREKIGGIATGQAAVTPAFDLSAKFVIHTVGPVWIDGCHNEKQLLKDCYRNSLNLALANKCKSVAFPLISTGTYGFPKTQALQIATEVIKEFVLNYDITVYLVVFDKKSFSISSSLFERIQSYIDENYVQQQLCAEYSNDFSINSHISLPITEDVEGCLPDVIDDNKRYGSVDGCSPENTDWDTILKSLDESFSESLLRLIDAKGMTHAQAYKKANIDKKHFNKIKNNLNYKPTKYTVLAFAIALKLNLNETKALMEKAGLALSKSNKFDLIVSCFIENEWYDIFALNEILFEYDLPLIGC